MARIPFGEMLDEDRRLQILRALDQALAYNLNEQVLKTALVHIGHNVGKDIVRAQLNWLEEHGLIRVDKMPAEPWGELWVATLLDAGQMVARGRYHPGIRRPDAG